MKKRIKFRYIFSVVILLLIVAIVYDGFSSSEFTQNIDSVIYSHESDLEKPTVVELHGELNRRLFGDDLFEGQITVDDNISYDVTFREGEKRFMALITKEDEMALIKIIGSVIASKELNEIWIHLNEVDHRYGGYTYIAGPASNKDQANTMIAALMHGIKEKR